jgi:hypothetical protein
MTSQKAATRNKYIYEKVCDFLKDTSLSEGLKRNHIFLQRSYGKNNALLGWNRPAFQDAISAVQTVHPSISEKTVAKYLRKMMVALFEQHNVSNEADPEIHAHLDSIFPTLANSAIEEEINKLLDLLKNEVKQYTIYVPLDGVELKINEITIGQSVIRRTDGSDFINEISELRIDDEQRNNIKQPYERSGAFIEVEVEGDFALAREKALLEAQQVVDILNLFVASCGHRFVGYQKICLGGQPIVQEQIFVGRTSRPTYDVHNQYPPQRQYELSYQSMEDWITDGLQEIVQHVIKENSRSNTLSSKIQRSVSWYSRGVNADDIDKQFVSLAIALEILLVGNEGRDPKVSWGSITQRLAERCAFLLGADTDERIDREKQVKELYGMRSKIVHEGNPVSNENLILLDWIAKQSILTFVQRQFPSWDEFLKWTKRQKYFTEH